ncbi:host-pathogen interaction-related protein [Moniliophthora roreri]|nr:host-pathogen interaction-related protein [Moniliophthora roreri]
MANKPTLVTLGMFIIDDFEYLDEQGNPTGKQSTSQIGGGGTYAAIGARIWLQPDQIGMVVDRGRDFPEAMQSDLEKYGKEMWHFRDRKDGVTTRALNSYRGECRGFNYLTPRLRITPRDLEGTKLEKPTMLHFICSPTRASAIISEVREVKDWNPITIYEPIPDRCVPEELPALIEILPEITILSPNAEEALSLLSVPLPPTKESIEESARKFLQLGVKDSVVVRSGGMGAYILAREKEGKWVSAFWSSEDRNKIVDVTGKRYASS